MKPRKTILYRYAKRVQEKTAHYMESVEYEVMEDVEAFFDLTYRGVDDNLLTMDVYRPKRVSGSCQDNATGYRQNQDFGGSIHKKYVKDKGAKDSRLLPVILMIHGGGLFVGEPRMETGICQQFARRGFLVCSLSYRLMTEADACAEISDICAGFRHAQSLLPEYGGDRDRVFLVGESAGAYLAVYACAIHRSKKLWEKIGCPLSSLSIRKMACFSGMFYTRKTDLIGILYPRQIYGRKRSDKEFMEMMDPEHPEIIGHLPPMLITSSDHDFLRKYTLSYAKALEREGIPCTLCYYTGNEELDHAFPSLKPWLHESLEVIDRLVRMFLDE